MQTGKLNGTLGEVSRLTVAGYLDRWLEDTARVQLRATTYADYKAAIANHITPRIGGVRVQKLTPMQVDKLYGDMERDGCSAYVRRRVHAILHKALNDGMRKGVVTINACTAATAPRVTRQEVEALTLADVQKLLKAADGDRMEALYVVAITSGLRMGELFALRWDDIDLESGSLTVRRKVSEVVGSMTVEEPKTAKGRRRVDLPQMTVDAQWKHKAALLAEGLAGCEWVFPNRSGGLWRRSNFHSSSYKPLLRRAGLPPVRFHNLRHTPPRCCCHRACIPRSCKSVLAIRKSVSLWTLTRTCCRLCR